ncbi:MAG: LamG domain-containing protein [Planctomycetota bacterium]|jgi:hypothetical protein
MRNKSIIVSATAVLVVLGLCGSALAVGDMVSHWTFDEGSGVVAYDSVGTNDGAIHGAAWTTGQKGGALSFDGSGDYVSVPDDASLNITGDITISAWVYLTRGGSYQAIVTKCVGSGPRNNPFDFRTNKSAKPLLTLVRADASGHERVYSNYGMSLNNWHHVLVKVDNKVPDFYVDGIVTGKWADTIFTKTPTGNTKPLLIGRRDDRLYFNGLIDDVRIYDRALSEQEIWDIYMSYLPEPRAIDIKPGSCPNPLNVKSRGLLPVSVLGTEDFDVSSIDLASIRLSGIAAIRSSFEDVGTPLVDANECECSTEGPDGFLDLTLKFETQKIVDAIGEVDHGDELVLELTGVSLDETPMEGSDCVIIRGRHKPINKADFNGNGIVDMADFAAFAENWLQSSIAEY